MPDLAVIALPANRPIQGCCIPIVDAVLRAGQGIGTIVVYAMNALADSAAGEPAKFLCHGYPDCRGSVSFRRYTSQEFEEGYEEIIANPSDILLSNYVKLELVLPRPRERRLVRAGQGLRSLVLGEPHVHRGREGAEAAPPPRGEGSP